MKNRLFIFNISILVLLILTVYWALGHGASQFALTRMNHSQLNILFNIRLPRIFSALIAGSVLAVSGAYFQAALRNPIAEPGIMGVSSAANLFQILAGLIFPGIFWGRLFFALVGGFICFSLLLIFQKKQTPYQLIIIGVALNAIFSGISSAFFGDHTTFSLATSTWSTSLYLGILGIAGLIFAIWIMNWANYLKVGDEELQSLGLNAGYLRLSLMAVAVFLASITTASCGVIMFIGIIVPQIVRQLVGYNYEKLIPASILLGAWSLLFVDTLGRTIMAPQEISANILFSIIGGPFMIMILLRRVDNAGTK